MSIDGYGLDIGRYKDRDRYRDKDIAMEYSIKCVGKPIGVLKTAVRYIREYCCMCGEDR